MQVRISSRWFAWALLAGTLYLIIGVGFALLSVPLSRRPGPYDGKIHLLLSDVQMPNMTGFELATQLQIERPTVRVLLMSGMVAGLLLLNEGWQFLPKPFMANMLKERVLQMLQVPEDGE